MGDRLAMYFEQNVGNPNAIGVRVTSNSGVCEVCRLGGQQYVKRGERTICWKCDAKEEFGGLFL
jgi:hypothetical protein